MIESSVRGWMRLQVNNIHHPDLRLLSVNLADFVISGIDCHLP